MKYHRFRLLVPFLFILTGSIIYINSLTVTPTTSGVQTKDFSIKDVSLTLQLPETTKIVNDNVFTNNEIAFSSYLYDKRLNYRGYIQVWKIADLNKFLEAGKAYSETTFTSYNQEHLKLKNLDGFKIEWTAHLKNEDVVSGREYFLTKEKNEQILRISFFTSKKSFPKQLKETANNVVSSIEWK